MHSNAIAFSSKSKSWYLKEDYAHLYNDYMDFIEEKKKQQRTPKKRKQPDARTTIASSSSGSREKSTAIVSRAKPSSFDAAENGDRTIKRFVTKAADKILEG